MTDVKFTRTAGWNWGRNRSTEGHGVSVGSIGPNIELRAISRRGISKTLALLIPKDEVDKVIDALLREAAVGFGYWLAEVNKHLGYSHTVHNDFDWDRHWRLGHSPKQAAMLAVVRDGGPQPS